LSSVAKITIATAAQSFIKVLPDTDVGQWADGSIISEA
jgi:hypothetical protein